MILGFFCGTVLACTAPAGHVAIQHDASVTMNGARVGVYVDDQVPHQRAVVAADVNLGELVIAGIPMCECVGPFPGAVNALEWYPYYNGRNWATPQPPPYQAYILQGRFRWPGDPNGATPREQRRLFRAAVRRNPILIITYNGS